MNILSKFQLPSSSGLGLAVFGRYLNKRMAYSVNELMNDGGVCRIAPATPGLVITAIVMTKSVFLHT